MPKEKILEITEVELYTPYEKESISEDDYFIEVYKDAFRLVYEMYSNNTEKLINNIVAFCGDRGSGKTSTMYTFSNILSDKSELDKLCKYTGIDCNEQFDNIRFMKGFRIDPSYFDDIHSIVDIIVAQMYRDAHEHYLYYYEKQEDHTNNEAYLEFMKTLNHRYELLQECFLDVYRKLSLVVDTNRILEREYDYSGDITKLSRLGNSLKLDEDFGELVPKYFDLMCYSYDEQQKCGIAEDSKNCILVVEIDDIDLCSNNAYRMIEQIRKYLMQNRILVLMALKVEQLDMCIQEKNLEDYSNMLNYQDEFSKRKIVNDVKEMSRAYLMKLIPDIRRIDLESVKFDNQTRICVDSDGESQMLLEYVSSTIAEKTGVAVCREELALLFSKNLRSVINLIDVVRKLPEENRMVSCNRLIQHIKNSVIWGQAYRADFEDYSKLLSADSKEMMSYIDDIYNRHPIKSNSNQEKVDMISLYQESNNPEKRKNAALLRLIYSLKTNMTKNQNPDELNEFINYGIWEDATKAILTGKIKGVKVDTIRAIDYMLYSYDVRFDTDEWLTSEGANVGKLCRKSSDAFLWVTASNKESFVQALINLLLFVKVDDEFAIINSTNPNFISKKLDIAWENYLVNLANFDHFINKSGIRNLYMEGQEDDSIIEYAIISMKEDYKEFIEYVQWVQSNPMLCDYINRRAVRWGDYRERSKKGRNYKSIERFMKCLFQVKEYLIDQVDLPSDEGEMCMDFLRELDKTENEPDIRIYVDLIDTCEAKNEMMRLKEIPIRFRKEDTNYEELHSRLEAMLSNVGLIKKNTNMEVDTFENKIIKLMAIAEIKRSTDVEWDRADRVSYSKLANEYNVLVENLKDNED